MAEDSVTIYAGARTVGIVVASIIMGALGINQGVIPMAERAGIMTQRPIPTNPGGSGAQVSTDWSRRGVTIDGMTSEHDRIAEMNQRTLIGVGDIARSMTIVASSLNEMNEKIRELQRDVAEHRREDGRR